MRREIVLVGPPRAGKSTLARLLGRRLGVPRVPLDRLRWRYFADRGYDGAAAARSMRTSGPEGLFGYQRPFEANALCRVLDDYEECVFDLGAGQTAFEDDSLFGQVESSLRPLANVYLLLPSPDPAESVRVLTERAASRPEGLGRHFIERLVHSASTAKLAKQTLYTAGRPPEVCADEILARAGLSPAASEGASQVELVDRSSYAKHLQEVSRRLPGGSDCLATLDATHADKMAQLGRSMARALDAPLGDAAASLVNECAEDADWALSAESARAPIADEAKVRLRQVMGRRLRPDSSLRELLACDAFDGIFPFQDGAALTRMVGADVLGPELAGPLRETLWHRFLHRPQRTRWLFLHELIVSFLLDELQRGGLPLRRRDISLAETTYEQLGGLAVREIARTAGRPVRAILALHAVDDAAVEAALPAGVRDALLLSSHVYFYAELFATYQRGWATRRLLANVVRFFTLPALERVARDPTRPFRQDMGPRMDERMTSRLYGLEGSAAVEASEVDLAATLLELADAAF